MTVAAHITSFRDLWADRFTDASSTCVIKRQTGESLNTTTGVITPTYTNQYSGVCIWRPGLRTDADAGEQQVEIRFGTLIVPYDTDGIKPDDLVDMTSTRDADLNGKQLVVRNVPADTYLTARKLFCEDNQGG